METPHIPAPSTVILQRVLSELDARLAQLEYVRSMFAALATPAAQLDEALLELEGERATAPAEAAPAALEPVQRRTRLGRPKGSKNKAPFGKKTRKQPAPEPRALATNIPVGPVVVSAAQVAQKRSVPEAAAIATPTMPSEGTLEALIREVEARRSAA